MEAEEFAMEIETTVAIKLHNTRIYKPEPSAIHCMVYNFEYKLLAVSRADSSIEIWALEPTPRLQRTFLLPAAWASVESLCWGPQKRLFCCGLHGHVLELDLQALSVKAFISVISGACWCIDIHHKSSTIAAGTEEGYINFVDITSDGLQFNRTLDKQEGRVLCVSWTPDGLRIAAGSPDAVRVWDTQSGHALHRLATGRDLTAKACLVWCVQCLDNRTFVSGDSRGKLCIWDLAMGVSIEEHQALQQDVLCLTVSQNRDEIYCSGIDPRISKYNKMKNPAGGARMHWTRSHQRRFHTHDVRAIAALGGTRLASGGVDTNMIISTAPPKRLFIFPHVPYQAATVAATAGLILLRYLHHLELRHLAKEEDTTRTGGQLILRLDARPEHSIACASISEQANWIAYSTQQHCRFFTLENSESTSLVLEKVRELPRQLQSGSFSCLQFSAKEAKRAVVAMVQTILVLELNHQAASVIISHTIATDLDSIHILCLSHDRRYLVAADLAGNVACWTDKKWQKKMNIPKRSCEVTAIGIPETSHELMLVYADHEILEYNLLSQAYTDFSRILEYSNKRRSFLNSNLPVTGISFDPCSSRVLLHDSSSLYVLNKELSGHSKMINSIQVLNEYKYVLHAEWLPSREIVVVRVTQSQLEEGLPQAPKLKKIFGSHT